MVSYMHLDFIDSCGFHEALCREMLARTPRCDCCDMVAGLSDESFIDLDPPKQVLLKSLEATADVLDDEQMAVCPSNVVGSLATSLCQGVRVCGGVIRRCFGSSAHRSRSAPKRAYHSPPA